MTSKTILRKMLESVNPYDGCSDTLKSLLSAILETMNRGKLNDAMNIFKVVFSDQNVYVHYTYFQLYGALDNNHFLIPLEVVDAANPIEAAEKFIKQFDLEYAKNQVTVLRGLLAEAEATLKRLEA
jgi:hypothetical protein